MAGQLLLYPGRGVGYLGTIRPPEALLYPDSPPPLGTIRVTQPSCSQFYTFIKKCAEMVAVLHLLCKSYRKKIRTLHFYKENMEKWWQLHIFIRKTNKSVMSHGAADRSVISLGAV